VIRLWGMKSALVVKALIDHILLVRMDTSELVTLSVPCGKINTGSLLVLDSESTGCLIESVDGKRCKSICRRQDCVISIERNKTDTSRVQLSKAEEDRNVI